MSSLLYFCNCATNRSCGAKATRHLGAVLYTVLRSHGAKDMRGMHGTMVMWHRYFMRAVSMPFGDTMSPWYFRYISLLTNENERKKERRKINVSDDKTKSKKIGRNRKAKNKKRGRKDMTKVGSAMISYLEKKSKEGGMVERERDMAGATEGGITKRRAGDGERKGDARENIYTYIYIYMNLICTYMYIYIYIHIYMVHIHTHVVHTHTHTHVYIYKNLIYIYIYI